MTSLNKDQIKELLPHREPFLFVDSIININLKQDITGLIKFPEDSYFFKALKIPRFCMFSFGFGVWPNTEFFHTSGFGFGRSHKGTSGRPLDSL